MTIRGLDTVLYLIDTFHVLFLRGRGRPGPLDSLMIQSIALGGGNRWGSWDPRRVSSSSEAGPKDELY